MFRYDAINEILGGFARYSITTNCIAIGNQIKRNARKK